MDDASPGKPIKGYPLFPLGMVLLPSEKTALHVFEERYRDLAARCLENDETFGLVLADESGEPREFGCATRIAKVLERHDDGRLDILVEGVAPIRLIESEAGFSYPAATIEWLADSPAAPGDDRQAELARLAFAQLVDALGQEALDPAELATMDSFAMASHVNLDVNDKQALLESRDEGDRLSLLERVFAEAAEAAAVARRLSGIASTNGHAPH
jgi:Lon protease-like protein